MRFVDVTLAYNVESYERVDQGLQEAIEAGETLVKPCLLYTSDAADE